MGYSSGMLKHRVEVLKVVAADGKFGARSAAPTYESVGCVWAAVDFNRGLKAMREAALDGIDYVVIRMRWNPIVNRDSYLRCHGVTYMITEFHADRQQNIIQIKAQEVVK